MILFAFIDLLAVVSQCCTEMMCPDASLTEMISGLSVDVVAVAEAVETAGVMSMPMTMRPSLLGEREQGGVDLELKP